jgi:UDP-glucose:(heptosyl)LPS alpha-1,3-glucosyltransferase
MDPARVEVISPGIHMADYQKLDRKICRQQIRTPLGIDATDVLILFVSMNFEIKGLDRLIQAVSKLSQNVKLLIVGKGNEQKYRHLAGQLGIADRVLFAGVVSREKLLPIYMAADIYAMLSAFDTFGMVVLEAMAASLPVIIGTHVGARDLVNEGENGFIIEEPGGIEEIADRIARMLNNDLRQRMGRAAFQTALHNTWDDVAQKVDAHYRSLLKIN